MISVLHVRTVVGAGGGADKTTLKSPAYLRGTRFRAVVAYLYPAGDPGIEIIRKRAEAWQCPLETYPERGFLDNISILRQLLALCRRLDVEIWHGHEYKSNFIGLLLQPLCRFYLVATVHGWVEQSAKLSIFYAIDRLVLRRYDRVVVVSRDLFETCLKLGIRRERLHLIHNAIESAEYRRRGPASQAPGRVGVASQLITGRTVPKSRLVVGAAGRLSPEKGFHLLIEAVSRLRAAGHDLELWVAGDGPEKAALSQAVQESGWGDRIHLLGFRSDTIALFECFDIFCLPSLREGLPNVVLEAMAMEVPLLATRCGGIEAALRDGEDCWLIPPGSVDALEDGLEALARDAQSRRTLAANARERVTSEFSFRHRMDKMIAVYDGLYANQDPLGNGL